MEFHEVTAADGAWAGPLLRQSGYASCEYAFVNIFMWAHVYHTRIARFEDWVIARSEGRHSYHYLFPAGRGDEAAALRAIRQDAEAAGKRLVIFSVSPEAKERMEGYFPGQYEFSAARANSDYLYRAADLANLPGKKYQKKRNHLSRFLKENPDWQFLPITPEVMPAIRQFNDAWCRLYDNRDDAGIAAEHRAIERVFRHYDELRLRGGYVTAGGRIVAFSFGSEINASVFDVHVEKALYDVNGAYTIINREMARAFGTGYEYINREDDVGEEGLRAAKLSYHPARMEEKWIAVLKGS